MRNYIHMIGNFEYITNDYDTKRSCEYGPY